MKNRFTEPKLKFYPPESNKQWYVWFRFNGGNPIRIYLGLNKIKDTNERLIEANNLAAAFKIKLEGGWIPDNSYSEHKHYRILEAIDYGFEKKKLTLSKNSIDNFQSGITFFKEAIKKLKFDKLLAGNFERFHAKECLEFIKTNREWTNHSYNKNLGYFRSVFHEILEGDIIKVNPFRDIKNLKVEESIANIPPTDEEMRLIADELESKCFGFYVFCSTIYYSGIRPAELTQIKVSMLDLQNLIITLPADITKTKKSRIVPIDYNLLELFLRLDLSAPDNYVFGTSVPNGGRHGKKKNYFEPNQYKVKEDTANKLWNELIKKGLKIDKNLYSLKHKGGDDKLSAGMDIETIRDIFGHSEKKMTERYVRALKLKKFEEARSIQLKKF